MLKKLRNRGVMNFVASMLSVLGILISNVAYGDAFDKADVSATYAVESKGDVATKHGETSNASEKGNEASGKENQTRKIKFFAVIDGQEISFEEFRYEFEKGVGETFYHGKISRAEMESYKRSKINQMILDTLLAQEARRRGLQPPEDIIKKKLDVFAERNKKSKDWSTIKKTTLNFVRTRLETEALVKLLKRRVVEDASRPMNEKVEQYYGDNKEVFTAPEQWKVSLILLLVDPSSSNEVWAETLEIAAGLVERIRDGESFEELARIHSGDPSAPDGGDMGYMHIGMLAKPAQDVLNVMKVGEVSEPVMLLKGVAIFRLDGVQVARLNALANVEDRATQLLMREQGEQRWLDLKKNLKKTKKIVLEDAFQDYLDLTSTN